MASRLIEREKGRCGLNLNNFGQPIDGRLTRILDGLLSAERTKGRRTAGGGLQM
jgi:hypothetical protein